MPATAIAIQQTVPQTVPIPASIVPRRQRAKRRNPLRGYCIVAPSDGQPFYRVRHADPEAKALGRSKLVFRRIPAEYGGDPSVKIKDASQRRKDFAAQVQTEIEERKAELRAGRAEPIVDADALLAEAIETHYFATRAIRKADDTVRTYRSAIRAFLAWCALPSVMVRTCRHVTAAKLAEYADYAAARPKADGEIRKGKSVNTEIKAVATILGALAKKKRIQLSPAQIQDALERVEQDEDGPGPIQRPESLRAILAACEAFEAARVAYKGRGRRSAMRDLGSTFLFILLTGIRPKEAYLLEWTDVALNADGILEITVRKEVSKTNRKRTISCGHSPLLAWLVARYAGRSGRILPGSVDGLERARQRLSETFGAPEFTCRELRRTCGTFLACAQSIFGDASAYMAARQLGHSIKIAEQHYWNVVTVSREARTTEDAMQLRIASHAQIPQL